jgi:diguanylate cyclase (GGDEF)-like protein
MITEKDSNLESLYNDLVNKFMRINRTVAYLALVVEVLYMCINILVGDLERSLTDYLLRYILRPFICTSTIYWVAHIGLKHGRKYNKLSDTQIAIIPLIVLSGLCAVLIRIHYIFPTLYGAIIMPTCLSLAFGSKKVERSVNIVSTWAITIVFIMVYFKNDNDLPEYYIFDVIMTYILMIFASLYVKYMIEFERRKDSLVYKYHTRSIDLTKEANTDSLTGLLNLKAFTKIMNSWVESGDRQFAFSIIDIDNFKKVNDTYGHSFGNIVLKRLSHILMSTSSDEIIVARYGGEEFCLLISGSNTEKLKEIVDKVRRDFKSQEYRETEETFSFSGGLATWDGECTSEQLIQQADEKLYEAKRSGKDRVAI